MDEVLSSFGCFDVPSESLKYIGGVTAHFLQRQKEQEIKHIAENYILIKQAIVHESDSMRRGMIVEKLKQLEQIMSKLGTNTSITEYPIGFFTRGWLGEDFNCVFSTAGPKFTDTQTQQLIQELREQELRYLKANLVLLKNAISLEGDITKRTQLNEQIQLLDEVLSSFGCFDVPSESLKYIGGVTAHFLQRQKEQEIKHIAENYILIKQAIVHESDSMRRGMIVEKLKQLEQFKKKLRTNTGITEYHMAFSPGAGSVKTSPAFSRPLARSSPTPKLSNSFRS